jgi:hypothetical protein
MKMLEFDANAKIYNFFYLSSPDEVQAANYTIPTTNNHETIRFYLSTQELWTPEMKTHLFQKALLTRNYVLAEILKRQKVDAPAWNKSQHSLWDLQYVKLDADEHLWSHNSDEHLWSHNSVLLKQNYPMWWTCGISNLHHWWFGEDKKFAWTALLREVHAWEEHYRQHIKEKKECDVQCKACQLKSYWAKQIIQMNSLVEMTYDPKRQAEWAWIEDSMFRLVLLPLIQHPLPKKQ